MNRRVLILCLFVAIVSAVTAYGSFAATQKPKQFIAIFKIARVNFLKEGPKPDEMPALNAHRDYWQRYTDEGICQIAGHTLNNDESAFGIALVKTESEKAARDMMDADPMVKAGILSVTVFPFEGLEASKKP